MNKRRGSCRIRINIVWCVHKTVHFSRFSTILYFRTRCSLPPTNSGAPSDWLRCTGSPTRPWALPSWGGRLTWPLVETGVWWGAWQILSLGSSSRMFWQTVLLAELASLPLVTELLRWVNALLNCCTWWLMCMVFLYLSLDIT